MNYSLEDAVMAAKSIAAKAGSDGIAVTRYNEYAIIAIDFSNPANAAIGAKKTGLQLPSGAVVVDGVFRANSAITAAFNLQVNATGDLLASQTDPAANARAALSAVANNTANPIEVTLNVTAAASAGSGVAIARILQF